MINITSLTKKYGKNRGIDNITFNIPEGQIVGFLGPNGAGKTTTMNIITGYLSANSGSAEIAGIDIFKRPIEAKKNIGYSPEHPPLYHAMTVKSYLNFIYEVKNAKISEERASHISDICEIVGITDVFTRVIGHLSKGYKQRVGLAQALIGNPKVLILDEPTVGLDPRQIVEIRSVIKNLGEKRTILLSSHILTEVSAICERVLVISNGVIVADDKPDNLMSAAGGQKTLHIRVAGPSGQVRQLLQGISGVKKVKLLDKVETEGCDFLVECEEGIDIRKQMSQALLREDYPILMLRPQKDSLEDIFLELTEG